MLTQTYNIDMIPSGVPLALHISQYDVGLTTFVFTPYVSVGTMDFSVVAEAYLEATKPDMRAIVHACTVGNGTITYTVQEQLAAVSGRVYSKLVLKDASGDVVASKAILWLVEPAGVADDAILSDSDLSGVSQVIQASTNFNDAVPTQTVSGEVLTFDDAVEGAPLEELVLHIEPHQSGSGDPSPSNIRPISGYDAVNVTRCGKNLLYTSGASGVISGVTYTVNDDGTIRSVGESTTNQQYKPVGHVLLPAGTYILSGCPSGGGSSTYRFRLAEGSYGGTALVQEYGDGAEFTLSKETDVYLRIYLRADVGEVDLTWHPMIRLASITDDTWEPYKGTTYPISLSSAGTVYGGSLDVTTGELVVDTIKIAVSDDVKPSGTNLGFATGTDANRLGFPIKTALVPLQEGSLDVLCNIGYASAIINSGSTFAVGACSLYKGQNCMYFRYGVPTSITTMEDAYQYLQDNNCEFTVHLETPLTYHLTPTEVTTLLGYNIIWMDADGTIDASYKVRLSSYFMALRTMLAPVEASYTATANYAVGDYLIVGTVLYKVTAAITSGETIAEGSNVTATTVMAEIKALQ